MRRMIPWLLLALLPIGGCGAEQAPAPAASTPAAGAATPPSAPPMQAAAPTPAPGGNYVIFPAPLPTQTPGKIEVAEVFLYTCPHCYAFEPKVKAWAAKLPPDVAFVRVPASFGPTGPLLSRSYYAAEAMGVLEKLHPAFFNAIHKEHRSLASEEDVLKLVSEQGVDQGAFRAALHSFAVDGKTRRAQQLEVGYGITGVPAMTVNGKYGISMGRALGPDEMLKVADQLIEQERKGR